MESRFPLNGFRIQYVARFQTSVGYRIPLANIFWISLLDKYLAFIVASINFWLSNKCVLDKFAVIVDSAVDVLHEIHRAEEAGIPTEYDIVDDTMMMMIIIRRPWTENKFGEKIKIYKRDILTSSRGPQIWPLRHLAQDINQ